MPIARHLLRAVALPVLLAVSIQTGPARAEDAAPPPREEVRGLVIPKTETTLSSEINGVIRRFPVDLGSTFKTGDTLLAFDCELYQAERRKAAAELDEAQKNLEVTRELEKLQSASTLEVSVAASRLDRARAELDLRAAQEKRCILTAPFPGRVIKRLAQPHQYVTVGQPLLEIADSRALVIQLFVPSAWLSWFKVGTGLTFVVDETGAKHEAKVTVLSPRIDQVSQTIEARAELKGGASGLVAGMSGTAVLAPGRK